MSLLVYDTGGERALQSRCPRTELCRRAPAFPSAPRGFWGDGFVQRRVERVPTARRGLCRSTRAPAVLWLDPVSVFPPLSAGEDPRTGGLFVPVHHASTQPPPR